jgi:hypothetical protein
MSDALLHELASDADRVDALSVVRHLPSSRRVMRRRCVTELAQILAVCSDLDHSVGHLAYTLTKKRCDSGFCAKLGSVWCATKVTHSL